MIEKDGRSRVVIEHVQPQINSGRFPIKRTVGERLTVIADVFADGHDEVRAALLVKHEQDGNWQEIPMEFQGNDRWEASFTPEKRGIYEYTVQGWVDHLLTWQKGLKKKFEASQDVGVELLIGANWIEEAAERAPAHDAQTLRNWATQLRNESNQSAGVTFALSQEVTKLVEAYPDKKYASLYHRTLFMEAERQKALFSTWYEFFPRSASNEPGKHGTFKDCEQLLPRIAEMGFDTIYLPPIHPIGDSNRKGANNAVTAQPGEPGSPWAIGSKDGGHKSIHPELGSIDDFVSLVNKAKEFNIEVAIDVAFQCSPDHPYVKEHPQWFRWRPDGSVQYAENPPKKYQDVLPINFETEDWENLWKELKSVFEYWISKGVYIFRVDNPHTKSFIFWEWCIREVRRQHPDAIFLAEAFTRPRVMEQLAKIGFNQSYTYYTWRNTQFEIKQYMTELTKTDMREYYRPNFWPNTPDILPEMLQNGGESAHISRVVMAATLSSNYGLYGPVYEFGINTPVYAGKEEYLDSEKYEVKHWDWNRRTKIRDVMTRINRIRRENPALQTTWNIEFGETDNQQLLCYAKVDDYKSNKILVVVNLDPHHVQSGWIKVPVQYLNLSAGSTYTVNDLMTDTRYQWHHEWNYVELHPGVMPVHVFRIE
ncbi:alpha-1,4-glucan--maltose-1-phosphate maltosyltransferase [Cytophagaceae bacterium YF14B1]|uniref:Alpha-1,4-glucan:maltose-1-phosphate maltosyltransferase n=1 Tax=Xanthocytophaga flava TaxID=3048013 RepID=A0AAE3U989_9BACT|nr:alpha-1,4-glucan--maltose-1-phosphate maltosyltransferase [Xanthocytophaga flavus]MDJ1483437.1 alpha-1,4-glucan--maltose-1-phosphate maltosyltransferase [Xanthocytophaga flavus]